jgi:hypothetical protein
MKRIVLVVAALAVASLCACKPDTQPVVPRKVENPGSAPAPQPGPAPKTK